MHIVNMHSDTLMGAFYLSPELDLEHCPRLQVDFRRMQEGGMDVNFFAIFLPAPEKLRRHTPPMEYEDYIALLYKVYTANMQAYPHLIRPALTAGDIEQNRARGLLSAVLTMEDGAAVYGDMGNLRSFYDMGVRALSLTWNFENCFGFPNSPDREKMALGLKPFGREAVVYMQELGMLVDVSHLSDGGFYDVAALCKKPFVATHSNCRALSPHPRNLTDEMLRILADHGGVSGLNFYGCFLNENTADSTSRIEDIVRHARHMVRVAGEDVVAIGTDFDGMSGEQEIADCARMPLLEDALLKAGFTPRQLDKLFSANVLRVMQEAL